MNIFKRYAHFYDTLYRDKDYRKECSYLEKIFKKYSQRKVKSILDIGCGTGGHAIILAKRGYQVEGIDFSLPMLKMAKEKVEKENLKINLQKADIRDFNLYKKFDACIAMFAVMGYQISNRDFASTLLCVRKHLKQNGLFIFDVWFGPGVLMQKPRNVTKNVEGNNEKIIRYTHSTLDIINHLVKVEFNVKKVKLDKILEQTKEVHLMRFFFPQEIKKFLEDSGFKLTAIFPFLKTKGTPTLDNWNITVVAKTK